MMAKPRTTQLTGAVGEFLVAAELCRLNLLAAPFAGNVPHLDIIGTDPSGGHIAVQVKAINGSTWQFDVSKFVNVQVTEDMRQIVGDALPEPFPGLFCVLVILGGTGKDRFFVLRWTELRDILISQHKKYLGKHGGRRPKAPESLHVSLSVDCVRVFENAWNTVRDHVREVRG